MNYLPFDLETALAHPERVVTRDGRKLTQLTKFEAKESEFGIIAVIEDEIASFRIDGTYAFFRKESNFDLFLLPDVKECWVNVFHEKGRFNFTHGYSSEDKAKYAARDVPTYIKTIRITNEPE